MHSFYEQEPLIRGTSRFMSCISITD